MADLGVLMVSDPYALACVEDVTTAWNRGDWSKFDWLHSWDVVYESSLHPRVVGQGAVVRRYQELVAMVPDLHSSELRLVENHPADHCATFELIQTGTFADPIEPTGATRRPGARFVARTTAFVRLNDDGRITALPTVHH